jgi:FkbM family methyltransferase
VLEVAVQTRDVALNKPAMQSSLSKWSSGKSIEADASVATDGSIVVNRFFHTDHENEPWWQVDLQDEFAIEQIRILNRREQSDRLRYFTVLISLTGEPDTWLQLYRKDTSAVFGRNSDTPFVIAPEVRIIARFVRIRLDTVGFLHFRKCEIMGYSPGTEERARLREETRMLQLCAADKQAQRECELAAGRRGHIAKIGSYKVFIDIDNYSPTLVRVLSSGDYEGREREIIRAAIRPPNRVLEIGTAIGVVTMSLASIVGASNVATYDANPSIVADARRNFVANGFDEISAHWGVMRNRSRWSAGERDVDFFVARDFWASRLHAHAECPGIVSVLKAPLVCLEDKIAEHQADVLICDIEGGEADLLIDADLAGIKMIIMETHYWACGRARIDAMIQFLILGGFNINLDYTSVHVVVLDRGA